MLKLSHKIASDRISVELTLPEIVGVLPIRADLDRATLDDANVWYEMRIDILQDDGTWRFDESFVTQCGPNRGKNGTPTQPGGFDLPPSFSGKTVRITLRRVFFARDVSGKPIITDDIRPIPLGLMQLAWLDEKVP